ncbi:MAG: molybdenum cofactor biosynthesis protein MoaE [Planctomycetes bacterium]|nr:molybdenum cofactor biosynthesis protein MoaE [Planctomycetota bacterium]
MRLKVRLFALLAEKAGAREIVLDDLPEALTLGDLKREIARRRPELGSLAHISGVVGTEYARDERELHADDEVSLLPPVSGGGQDDDAALARGVFLLVAEPLDVQALADRVWHASCGAVCTFVGTTRDTNRDSTVVRLDYEAFEAMTGPEMARIFARCRAELGAEVKVRMLCAHRTGTVAVGEPSVLIAVASPHRDAAFRACRFLIDELKRTLPIWKKEIYSDGHHWIGDRS